MFSRIEIEGWRQFRTVEVDFHEKLTVLTGANGAGKTTILNILNRHFGWNIEFVSTLRRERDFVEYFSDYWRGELPEREPRSSGGFHHVGKLSYADGREAELSVPQDVDAPKYNIKVRGQRPVAGVFVSSHRPVFFYEGVEDIPTKPDAREQLLAQYLAEMRSRYRSRNRVKSPSHRLKEALISLAVFGYGNQVVAPNPEHRQTFEGYQDVLRTVLPRPLGFRALRIEMPEVLLETDTGNFSLDAVSGGISAIIDLAWRIFMYSLEHDDFAVVIDEPENHLHPELQQTLLASLVEAFPQAQFIVATHNPFMITSVPDSRVYALQFGDDGKVDSRELDLANRAGTANQILRDVLGLDFTLPIWASRKLDDIVDRYSQVDWDESTLADLRADLKALGFESALPEALNRLPHGAEDD